MISNLLKEFPAKMRTGGSLMSDRGSKRKPRRAVSRGQGTLTADKSFDVMLPQGDRRRLGAGQQGNLHDASAAGQ
jgi:hypothetical protein